jgi:deoxyinosine 3'endonuclease (endonuclease V)
MGGCCRYGAGSTARQPMSTRRDTEPALTSTWKQIRLRGAIAIAAALLPQVVSVPETVHVSVLAPLSTSSVIV